MRKRKGIRFMVAGALALGLASIQVAALAGDGSVTLSADLTGKAEGGKGDSDGKGDATIKLDKGEDEICFELSWDKIDAPKAAHIHKGRKGHSGDIVVTLFKSDDPLPSTIDTVKGCVEDVKDKVFDKLEEDPEDYYVDVHNKDHPDGAIRGQLEE